VLIIKIDEIIYATLRVCNLYVWLHRPNGGSDVVSAGRAVLSFISSYILTQIKNLLFKT